MLWVFCGQTRRSAVLQAHAYSFHKRHRGGARLFWPGFLLKEILQNLSPALPFPVSTNGAAGFKWEAAEQLGLDPLATAADLTSSQLQSTQFFLVDLCSI